MAKDYVTQLSEQLVAARNRVRQGREVKALKDGAPTLFEIIDTEISLELNRAYGDAALTYEEYLESHGAVRGIRRIRNLLDAREGEEVQASQQVEAIQTTLKQIEDDKKQQ